MHERERKPISLAVLVVAIGLLLLPAVALARVSNADAGSGNADYELAWWTVDGGGGILSAGGSGYMLMGTAGQPETGPALAAGDYTLIGGFWPAASAPQHDLYLPLVLRNFR